MQINIRKYESQDEVQLKHLIKLCYENENLITISKSPKMKVAYSAFDQNKLVGAVFAWKNDFHPFCTYFRLLISPEYKKEKIAGLLLSKLQEQDEVNLPLQTSIWETNASLCEFYKATGFETVRKTYLPRLPVSDLEIFLSIKNNYIDYSLKTLAEITTDNHMMEKLTQLVKRAYEQTHMANPVAEIGLEKWKRLILSEDTLTNGSYVYVDSTSSEILAFSLLHESDSSDTVELGWSGSTNHTSIKLIPQLILQQIIFAEEKEYKYMEGEFDTTSKFAMEVLRTIPFPSSAAWVTFQKHKK
ncbi:hypothetical protein CIL03_18270 [Virgibacillus indicus]|uniref:N-acetyltransferase domain-containing protein n=1 Tax=Virgibacillus indicus TaxID=2024554 RepID=A0A265N5S5_9BACI|nr:GNAT family N-acetyltransferase [Virgibacillus indicus]OZU87131.1 hypothetical protein CIL03_18270 [Virgibacillus indicus]